MESLRPGDIGTKSDGTKYQIIALATHRDTKEQYVVYQELSHDFKIYTVPYKSFDKSSDKIEDSHVNDRSQEDKQVKIIQKRERTTDVQDIDKEERDTESKEVNKYLLEFLNADTYKQKIEVLSTAKGKIDERVLDNMAVSVDFVLPEGSLEAKYQALVQCIRTYEKFETRRR